VTASRQQTANRENAPASTGPRTAAGQARAKRNPRRHGFGSPQPVERQRCERVTKSQGVILAPPF